MLSCESVSCKTGTLKTGQTNPQPISPPWQLGVWRTGLDQMEASKLRQIEASCTSTYRLPWLAISRKQELYMALLLVMWCVRGGLLATVDFILTVGQYQCFRHGTVMLKH